ncbi:MAG TPA: hypothetical protein VI322_01805 [Candidatus Saccharimonadia bacterium]
MLVFPRYSHHSLSWRLVSHRQTSYALLTFLVLAVGILLASVSWSSKADSDCGVPSTPSCSGSYTVKAVVPGPRPTKPSTILSPSNGQAFATNPVTVSGTCQAKSLVKIFSNGILVGSVLCGADGKFSVPVDLVVGKNDLTALPYNTLDQVGPSSPTVTVTLNQPPGGLGFSSELIIQSESYYHGSEPGQEIVWPVELVGGSAPYAVSVDWGDGTTDVQTRVAPGAFTVKHTYQKSGTGYLGSYPLIIRAADAAGHTAYLQLTTIVNSAKADTNPAKAAASSITTQWLLWPLWVVVLLMVASFWLGGRREKKIMQRQLEALA